MSEKTCFHLFWFYTLFFSFCTGTSALIKQILSKSRSNLVLSSDTDEVLMPAALLIDYESIGQAVVTP